MIRVMSQPQDLLRAFHAQGAKMTLAARVSGPAKSAYPKGAPQSNQPAAAPVSAARHINETKNIDVVVVADSDIFDDRFWVQVQDVLGQRMAVPTADNAAFVVNAVENMMGSPELISLRTRARSERPFTVVEALRRNAETRFRAEAERLQMRVTEAESRLRELQGGSEADSRPGAAKGEMLSPAQQQAIERFRRELLESRAALRDVQANLRADVERLGARLAFINIALVPILVSAFAIGLALVRRRRRAQSRGL
jgi:ABC-type uncharacterized transport system involved in gliding motility auxiliary subunit